MVKHSPDRVDTFCEHFGTCGGCKWQMLPYAKQLEYKQNEVAQNLRRPGHETIVGQLEEVLARRSRVAAGAHPTWGIVRDSEAEEARARRWGPE